MQYYRQTYIRLTEIVLLWVQDLQVAQMSKLQIVLLHYRRRMLSKMVYSGSLTNIADHTANFLLFLKHGIQNLNIVS